MVVLENISCSTPTKISGRQLPNTFLRPFKFIIYGWEILQAPLFVEEILADRYLLWRQRLKVESFESS